MTDPARPNAVDYDFAAGAPRLAPQRSEREQRDDERRELDHRLANSLQLAADFLIFEHMRSSDPQARAALIATAERLSAVGQMHRFLASRRHARGVDLKPFLEELGGLIGETTGLVCDVEADDVTAPGEVAQQIAIAVNELAMNAAKHAYPWGERGPLHVTCRREGANLVVSVADEGQGLDRPLVAADKGGLGMTIVRAIARQLGARLNAETDGGARFTLTLPAPAAKPAASRSFAPPSDAD